MVSAITEPHLLAQRNPHTSQQETGTEPASAAENHHQKPQPHATFLFHILSFRKTMPYSLLFCVTSVRLDKEEGHRRLKPLMLRYSLKFRAVLPDVYHDISYQLPEEGYHIHMQQKSNEESQKTSHDFHLV